MNECVLFFGNGARNFGEKRKDILPVYVRVHVYVCLSLHIEEGDDHSNGDDDECDETYRDKEATTNNRCHLQWAVQVLVVDIAIGI